MKQSPPNTAQTLLVVRLTFLQLTQLKVGSSYVSRTGRVQSWPFPKKRPHPGPQTESFQQVSANDKFGILFTFLELPSPSIAFNEVIFSAAKKLATSDDTLTH